jgi:lipopolysaccharide heptosyltransferase II
MNEDASGILIFEPNWIGDILFTFPFLRTLREALPSARISCVVVPEYAELFAHNPWINGIYELSGRAGLRPAIERLRAVSRMRGEKFDVCFFLKLSLWRTLLARTAGIRERVGFEGVAAPLTVRVPSPAPGLHQIDRILTLTRHLGMETSDDSYEHFISDQDREQAGSLLPFHNGRTRRFVTLNPGANWHGKRWPSKYFSELGSRILGCFAEIELIITGAKDDFPIAEEISSKLPAARCHNVAGKTSLNRLAALFEMSAVVISADTGPLHLASAIGANTIGLFGPTSPERTGPRGRGKNIVVRKAESPAADYRVDSSREPSESMRSITPREVFDVARALVEAGS